MAASFLEITSLLFGWIYTFCWSLSFYPQPFLNWRRKSTSGTTIDFPAINVLGFVAYLVSNVAFFYSPQIRQEYALRHHGLTPTVQLNDVAFAAHAVLITAFTLSQFLPKLWGFDEREGHGARVSKAILGIQAGSFLGVGIVILIVLANSGDDPKSGWGWIDVIYAISYVKLLITLVKYMPQVLTNYRNKSTQGWSIAQILLDFTGGVLSIAQLGIDSYLQADWSGMTGNPVKLALGNISIFFDVIFIVQHYGLYRHKRIKEFSDEEDSLLDGSSRTATIG